ncbi:MAG: FkbM family methyltransferase [Polyangiaceae bacterium]|nr:FkbM family methyltransferase [Polyangiaceae bacterium]
MGPIDTQRLDRATRLASATPLRKLATRPMRLGASKVLEVLCRAVGAGVPVVARTFWGERMRLVVPDRVSLTILRYGFFEEELTRVFIEWLKPGMVFFDVGSHFGYFSLLAANLVGPGGQVHAFEPTPSTFRVLAANLRGRTNARAVNAAAYREDTVLEFKDYGVEFSAFNTLYQGKVDAAERRRLRASVVKVRARALDRYVEEAGVAPDFVKIDVEGAEPDVLRGFDHTLRDKRPMLSLEVGDKDIPGVVRSRDVVQSLIDRGYRALQFERGHLVPHLIRERYDYENLLFVPA